MAMSGDLVKVLVGPPHSDQLAAIMDEIEQERRSDLPRQIEPEPRSDAGYRELPWPDGS